MSRDDMKDVIVGVGRVVFCGNRQDAGGQKIGDQWALPGGRYTQNPAEAKRVAAAINNISWAQGHQGAAHINPLEA